MKLAALGLGYAAASGWVGAAKSTLCRWLQREPLEQPELTGRVLELDGLWTRTAAGRVEMKVIRDESGVALATFASWEEAIDQAWDQAWQQGAKTPVHVVSDGDRAIAAGLAMVYGREVPHQSIVPLSSAAGVPAQPGLGRLAYLSRIARAGAAGVGQRGRRAAVGAAGGGLD